MTDSVIYAHKGEWITCENDHNIAQLMEDVFYDQEQDLDNQFGNWTQKTTEVGADPKTCLCVKCGAPFYRGYPGIYYIDGEWRGPVEVVTPGAISRFFKYIMRRNSNERSN